MASFFSGVTNFIKGAVGWDDIEVSQVKGGGYTTEAQKAATEEELKSLWQQALQYRGMDVTSLISVPVWIFEPTTFLVRMCEPLAFEKFLKMAAAEEDPAKRLGWVATFCVAILSTTERTGKPFNPILGETFEYVAPDKSFKYISEQVSHHPPVGVALTTGQDYELKQETRVSTKFFGNSIEIYALGHTELLFKKFNEHWVWISPTSAAHNLVVGGMWIDHFGTVEIVDVNGSGWKCTLNFTKSGWFSEGRYEVEGKVTDPEGKDRMVMAGKWNSNFVGATVDEHGKRSKEYDLWNVDPANAEFSSTNKWMMPPFVVNELLALDKDYEGILPETDSRVRGDRLALELGDLEFASKEKSRLEEKQRDDKKTRQDKGEEWTPRYFKKITEGAVAPLEYQWDYIGKYWEEKEERIKTYEEEQKNEAAEESQ